MLKKEDITLHFRSKIDASYRDELEHIFFFNRNQARYAERITQSVKDFSKPTIKEEDGEIALVFEDQSLGQTLHIFDSDEPDANLIGVVMFERDSRARITIIHIALHERCREIFEEEGLNITALVIKKLFSIFKLIKGVERVRIYYINKEVKIDAFQLNGNYHK